MDPQPPKDTQVVDPSWNKPNNECCCGDVHDFFSSTEMKNPHPSSSQNQKPTQYYQQHSYPQDRDDDDDDEEVESLVVAEVAVWSTETIVTENKIRAVLRKYNHQRIEDTDGDDDTNFRQDIRRMNVLIQSDIKLAMEQRKQQRQLLQETLRSIPSKSNLACPKNNVYSRGETIIHNE